MHHRASSIIPLTRVNEHRNSQGSIHMCHFLKIKASGRLENGTRERLKVGTAEWVLTISRMCAIVDLQMK